VGMALRCMMALRWPRPDSELLCLCIFPVFMCSLPCKESFQWGWPCDV